MIEKILGFVPIQAKLVIGGVLVIAAGLYGFSLGIAWNADDLKECEATVDDVRRISDELAIKNEEQRLVSERITKDVSKSWSAALDYAKSNPRIVRVRENCSGSLRLPTVPTAAEGIDATGTKPGLGASIDVAQCEEVANKAVFDAAQLTHLQYWINQQHEASK